MKEQPKMARHPKSASFGVLEDLANCARHRRHPGGRKFDLIAAFALSSPRLLSSIDRSTMKKTRGLSINEEEDSDCFNQIWRRIAPE